MGSIDTVNKPPHYNKGEIETIDYIVDVLGEYEAISYCHGNVIKYTGTRLWEKGNPIEDAKKAVWYLNKMIELMEKDERSKLVDGFISTIHTQVTLCSLARR